MLLVALVAAPFAAALLAAFASGRDGSAAARLSLVFSLIIAALAVPLVTGTPAPFEVPWFRLFGTVAQVEFSLASDGLSGWLVMLVAALTPVALWAGREHAGDRMREYAVAVFALSGLMILALLARDLVVFYLGFEGMLVPMMVLIALFGGSDRRGASLQFFLYTMLGSVPLLVGIWWIAHQIGTTSVAELSADGGRLLAGLDPTAQGLLFAAFALAFAVKVPLLPLHGWQARAYAECPSAAAVLLAGAMAKLGTYGLLRFVLPLFPSLSAQWAWLFIALGLAGVVGGALLAWAATDVKRLIAFSSLSHLGLVVAGIFTFRATAVNGAAVQMVAHGLSVAALFLVVGAVERRAQRRGIDELGGLARPMPVLAVLFVTAALASAALPGTANFAGEFLLLMGLWEPARWWIAAIAGLGTILSAVYLLRLVQRWLYGPARDDLPAPPDLAPRETAAIVPLLVAVIVLGFFPKPIADRAGKDAAKLAEPALTAATGGPTAVAAAPAAAAATVADTGTPHADR